MALESKNAVTSIYDTGTNNDEEATSIIEKISTNIDEQNLIINRIAITQLIDNLEEREKQVILLRYYRGKTQTEISQIMGKSQVQISRIEKKALDRMRKKLTGVVV